MSDHYYTSLPLSSEKLFKIENVLIRGDFYSFYTAPGVFSSKKIDKGTLLLAEYMAVPKGHLLDLGCGIGVLGIVAAKSSPKTQVILTDVNVRATWLTRKNVELNGVKQNVRVRTGNLYEPVKKEKFDAIVSNPPVSAGLKVIEELVEGSKTVLTKGGKLQLVVRKGVKAIMKSMEKTFGNVEIVKKKGGYNILKNVNKDA
ncbi:MAG: class I SAM-dependent methyltransferase [Candidatus Wukongarchaeota archaeon]|nr:methyltransferase [Candidatus Wukongarchaeota archaeon]MDO8129117.1 methyltransferase [Candidatus Wukongarchaeota archaeon]